MKKKLSKDTCYFANNHLICRKYERIKCTIHMLEMEHNEIWEVKETGMHDQKKA